MCFYFLGERYISPDLDLLSLSDSDGRFLRLRKVNIVLGLFGLFWVILWLIYAWLINKHRSFFSHGLIVGTVLRMAWLSIPFLFIINWIATLNGWTIDEYWYQFYCEYYLIDLLLGMFFGLLLSDCIHILLDSEFAKNRLYISKSSKRGNNSHAMVGTRNLQDRTTVRKKWIASFRNNDKIIRSQLYKRYKKVVY